MNKQIICIAASLALILFLAASNDVVAYDAIGPACTEGSTTQKVSFVHVGDLHAHFDLVEDEYSRIRAFLKKVRLENPYTIFTNAGDDHEKGSVAEQYSRGNAVTEATVAMQFDVRTIGNHDFAWGVEHLLAYSRDPHSMVLSSNTHYDGADLQGLGSVDYGMLQVGCLRIGFFGLVGESWNELDQQVAVDYLPSLHTTFNYSEVARSIVDAHRDEVDLMVMVSHLGFAEDKKIAAEVNGIDLVLGGHDHGGPKQEIINNTLIVQPHFYGYEITRVDMDVDLVAHRVLPFSVQDIQEQLVWELTEIDSTVHQAIGDILTTYAPDAQQPIAYLEHSQDNNGRAAIAAKAGIKRYAADAALLDPARANPYLTWSSGEITPQNLIDGYFVEKQPSNTPGINALYMVEVSGADLQLMKEKQPTWSYSGPLTPNAGSRYKVIIHKGPALNPDLFFSGVNYFSTLFLSETWEALAGYGADRTAACLSLDTDLPPSILSCRPAGSYSVWTFSNQLKKDVGPGTLDYWDPSQTNWGANRIVFSTTTDLSLPPLADGHDSGVMAFPATSPTEGFVLSHNAQTNGDFSADGLVSNYTLIMDVLWPEASAGKWRALLQTSANNSDDADWFVGVGDGIGINGSYFSALLPNQWYRMALVARTAVTGGTLQFFVDGQFVGELANAGQRWALGPTALLFADENNETAPGYVAGILFAGYAMTKSEVLGLGKASNYHMKLTGDLNGDGAVTMTDAIIALQVMVGMQPSGLGSDDATYGTDVGGDGKIGMPELLYILQAVAGAR